VSPLFPERSEEVNVLRVFQISAVCVVALLMMAVPAMAQEGAAAQPLIEFSSAAGAGIIMLGAAFGIARIGAAACESMARQPEASGDIRGGMLLTAAFIEGATFFALVVCLIGALNGR
jgi:F-type H+-transporting ATPase subunit c